MKAATTGGMPVRVTYFLPTGAPMATGIWPFPGAAACSVDLAIGTRLRFADGREVVCLDRGHLGRSHVDVFVESHAEGQETVDRYGSIAWVEVIEPA